MADAEYPKRPKFYANRVTRLMFKTAMANDLGSDVCYLVTQIAHQEDASRYAGPVTFWNEQLMAVCGFKNVRALDRARERAIKAGWLVYYPGGKGKVGKYWTAIPEKYAHYEDGSIDESNSAAELATPTDVTDQATTNVPEKRQRNAEETPDIRQRNARETPEKCLTFLPSPNPSPSPNTSCSEVAVPPSKPEAKGKAGTVKTTPEAPAETVLTFPCNGDTTVWHLVQPQIDIWQGLYPGVDAAQECRSALGWCQANSKKRKTAGGMMAFLVAWLNKAQNESTQGNGNGNKFGRRGGGNPPEIGAGQRYDPEAAAKRGVHDF